MQAAFFDVDGTLSSSNVVLCYRDVQSHRLSRPRFFIWSLFLLLRVPYYLLLDVVSRARFNEAFFRNYRGMPIADLESWGAQAAERFWRPRLYAEALEQLGHHRAQAQSIVLVSGGIEATLRPLARLLSADALVCARLRTRGLRFTGSLVEGPLSGNAKVEAVQKIAEEMGLDLQECYAYADSYADRQFLECVGHPTAVNPDRRLRRLALERGWPIRHWATRGQR